MFPQSVNTVDPQIQAKQFEVNVVHLEIMTYFNFTDGTKSNTYLQMYSEYYILC